MLEYILYNCEIVFDREVSRWVRQWGVGLIVVVVCVLLVPAAGVSRYCRCLGSDVCRATTPSGELEEYQIRVGRTGWVPMASPLGSDVERAIRVSCEAPPTSPHGPFSTDL